MNKTMRTITKPARTIKNKTNPLFKAMILSACFGLIACADQGGESNDEVNSKPAAKNIGESPEKPAAGIDPLSKDGIAAPLEFTLTDLDGVVVSAEDFRGQWLVLNYWATWCGPCRDEMPELVKFQADNENVQILGIAYEDADVEKLINFANDFAVNYPLLTMDVYNPPEFAVEGGMGLPTTIVYNPEGMRHKKHMGPLDANDLLEMIQ